MRQILILVGSLALMLGWVWLVGLMVGGSPRQATAYFRSWWRVVKWMAVAGLVLGLILIGTITAPD